MSGLALACARHRWRAAAVVTAALVVCALKAFYRHASADDLSWVLAPTTWLVSLVTRVEFAFEAGTGWVGRDARFIIAPACAGVNFLLAAFIALVCAWLPGMRSPRGMVARLVGALAVAGLATLVVNTARIAIAMALHHGTLRVGGLSPADVHRVEGIAVYLGGLCLLHGLARSHERRRSGADRALAR